MIIQGDQQIAAKQGDSGELEVKVNGNLVAAETNKAVTADTDILTTAYTATKTGISALLVSVASVGVLSLVVNGVSAEINDGVSLDAGKWYEFEVLMAAGSTYNLQYSVSNTLQIQWVVR
jgi:hypothetical protein